jgi:hypothetical protein
LAAHATKIASPIAPRTINNMIAHIGNAGSEEVSVAVLALALDSVSSVRQHPGSHGN